MASSDFAVSVSGTFSYTDPTGVDETITVTSGDIKSISPKDFQFTLADPVQLGTITNFITWLTTQVGINSFDLSKYASDLPPVLSTPFNTLLNSTITITSLMVNVPQSQYAFGVSVGVDATIFGSFKLDGIGIVVSSGGTGA